MELHITYSMNLSDVPFKMILTAFPRATVFGLISDVLSSSSSSSSSFSFYTPSSPLSSSSFFFFSLAIMPSVVRGASKLCAMQSRNVERIFDRFASRTSAWTLLRSPLSPFQFSSPSFISLLHLPLFTSFSFTLPLFLHLAPLFGLFHLQFPEC